MRYFLIIILGLFLWTGCNDDDEKLTPSTEPEFRYVLPQGNHDYDTKIVSWYEDCGIYFLYKFEDKDVYYNENDRWAGFVDDTMQINDGELAFYNAGLRVELPDEEYVGKQLEWIEKLFLNHYSKELLKKKMVKKVILAKNVTYCYRLGNKDLAEQERDYFSNIANTLIFSHGDASVEDLTNEDLLEMKNDLHLWMLTEKLVDDYPVAELEDFLSVTDYSKTLSADYYEEWMAEGWLGRLANSEEAARSEDIRNYVEMIITTPKEMLEIDVDAISYLDPLFWVIRNYNYAGFLHPSMDVAGNIKKKYDLIVAAFKDWGVDLPVIGELYYE